MKCAICGLTRENHAIKDPAHGFVAGEGLGELFSSSTPISEKFGKEKKEMMAKRVPVECPFCRNIDMKEWNEFKVKIADVGFMVNGVWKTTLDPEMQVFCTRCEEEILPMDLGLEEGDFL